MVKPSFPLQEKFVLLEDRTNLEVVERNDVIATMILALIARVHHFQLGAPGIAKSMVIKRLMSHIGGLKPGDYFWHLLTKFSTPEELFGPYDIPSLKNGKYRRVEDLMLEVALLAFIDEIWKGSSSILNGLLTIINEREFKNDGKILQVPLWSLFCASNELPEGAELNAMFDRIHFRHQLTEINEQGNFIQMLQLEKLQPVGELIDWVDIENAAAEAEKVEVTDDVYNALNQVRNDMKAKEINPSDRRFHESIRVIKANAWRRGDTMTDIEDLQPLAHMFWERPEDAPTVFTMLLNLATPMDKEAQELIDEVEKLDAKLTVLAQGKDNMEEYVLQQEGLEVHTKAKEAKKDYDDLKKRMNEKGRTSTRMDKLRVSLKHIMDRIYAEVFDIDDEDPTDPLAS